MPVAVFFTITAPVATAEMLLTGLYLPWPVLTYTLAAAAAFLTVLAAVEWSDLYTHRHAPKEAITTTDTTGEHVALLDRDGKVIASKAATIKTRNIGSTRELSVEQPVMLTGVLGFVDTLELRDATGQCQYRTAFNSYLFPEDAVAVNPGW